MDISLLCPLMPIAFERSVLIAFHGVDEHIPKMNNLRKATGLTGLAVAHNPAYTLNVMYGKILRALQNLPKEAAYRKYTEEIVTKRSTIVSEAKSVQEIEDKINAGIVEELIVQAENELRLVRNFSYSKPWEDLVASPPPNQWKWPPTK